MADESRVPAAFQSPDAKPDDGKSDYYWNSYAHFAIHEEMIKDEVRTRTYRNSILMNKHLFKDKIVLDVGCGTGILSMFAAQAGAKHVYGVDYSDIVLQAQKIVKANNLDDKVTLVKSKVEDLVLPVDKVDIIISEWMGYFLLYENMLEAVLFARDKWLVEGGIIMPDKARIYIAAIEDGNYKDEKINWWERVYGFDMSVIKEAALKEPIVDVVDASSVVTDSAMIFEFDIHTVKKEDFAFKSSFTLNVTRNDYIHAFVSWFETDFSACHKTLVLPTGPHNTYTHWKQTVFYLKDMLLVSEGDQVTGYLSSKSNEKNPRDLDIKIGYKFKGEHQEVDEEQEYFLR